MSASRLLYLSRHGSQVHLLLTLDLPDRLRRLTFPVYRDSTVSSLARDMALLLACPPDDLIIMFEGGRQIAGKIYEAGSVLGLQDDYWGEGDSLLSEKGIVEDDILIIVRKVWRPSAPSPPRGRMEDLSPPCSPTLPPASSPAVVTEMERLTVTLKQLLSLPAPAPTVVTTEETPTVATEEDSSPPAPAPTVATAKKKEKAFEVFRD